MSKRIQTVRRNITRLDKQFLWHPFTQMKEWVRSDPLVICEGQGNYLKDIEGRWYLDGVSSLWVNVHGHRRQEIDEAIRNQLDKISHSTMLGLTHPTAAELGRELVRLAPSRLKRVFYSDNGSTAVEIALKMAFQYWQLKGKKTKTGFVALRNAYHGDTLGSVSVGGIDVFHNIFKPLLFDVYHVPSPYCYRCELNKRYPSCRLSCLKSAERIIKKYHKKLAAMIIEPIVQGAGGMIISPPGYLKGMERLSRKYDMLFIADEVATGFGKTGKMFACEHEGVRPDMMCLAKGITGGYLPLAATLTTEAVYRQFLGKYEELKTFFHGHSYTGNQLACAAALANISLFRKQRVMQKLGRKIKLLHKYLEPLSNFPHVGEVRQMGVMVGIELVRDKKTTEPYELREKIAWRVCNVAREKGLIIRPLGNVVVLMPPLSIEDHEIKELIRITSEAIIDVTGSSRD